MEIKINNCSAEEHEEIKAICFCIECKIYMCNKCEKIHSKLCKFHHWYNLDQNLDVLFTGFCKEIDHVEKLDYFCKDHNKLCCALCITKIKGKGKGQHKDCNVCFIEEIKDEKKNKLQDNIKSLENLSNTLNQSINQLKIIIETINNNKEELKLKVQKIFTTIRSEINEREDKLLLDINKIYQDKFFKEDIIKECEKLPNKIKISLEKGKIIDENWTEENKLNYLIDNCINIENNIRNINTINETIKKCNNSKKIKIIFIPEEESKINQFVETIRKFGYICEDKITIVSKIIDVDGSLLIKNWISENSHITCSLLYRMSEDGNSFDTFHNKCDNQYPALFIAKTNDGHIFGGYTSIGWNNRSDSYLTDDKSFLFSINKEKKYILQGDKKVIGCFKNRGVDFHNDCYFYQGNMTKCYSSGNYSFLKGIGKVLADNKEDTFIVEEVEIFKVTYN